MAKIWLVFNGLDVLTTHFALRLGAVEANPILGELNSTVGEAAGYGLKLFLAIVVAFLLYKTRRVFLFKWLNTGLGLVVLFNVGVLAYCFLG
jgi:hypothetical protein